MAAAQMAAAKRSPQKQQQQAPAANIMAVPIRIKVAEASIGEHALCALLTHTVFALLARPRRQLLQLQPRIPAACTHAVPITDTSSVCI